MTRIIWDSPGSWLSRGDRAHGPQRAGGELKWSSGEKTQRLTTCEAAPWPARHHQAPETTRAELWSNLLRIAWGGRAGTARGVMTPHTVPSHSPSSPEPTPMSPASARRRSASVGPRMEGPGFLLGASWRIRSILAKWPGLYCLLYTPIPARDIPPSFSHRAPSCPTGILFHFSKPQNGLSLNWGAKEAHSARGPHATHSSRLLMHPWLKPGWGTDWVPTLPMTLGISPPQAWNFSLQCISSQI